MAPLVHMMFRQSRTLRDVIVTSCMLDLPQEDVSTALDLALAHVEGLLRAGLAKINTSLPDHAVGALTYRMTWPGGLMVASCQKARTLLPMLVLAGWFALSLTAVAGLCALVFSIELHMAAT